MYELDLTLRNNITTEEHPLGVYPSHAQYHNIKKENIGLIEVMGLAVLPSRLKEELEIVAPSISTPVRRLSGGNVQKVLVGREIASSPTVLMTAYPVRGLDINSSYTIYNLLNEQKKRGVAVILVGEDLDVLLELCDRILVLCGGKVSGIVDGPGAHQGRGGPVHDHVGGGKEAAQDA